jgi:diaminohydroxyphosphoribosylaminopyrimidine deaminase/5-amino-6-(5-phosphoribosylamino)uracil reductase
MDVSEARWCLQLASRCALRGLGLVEPNPLVGCVLVRPGAQALAQRVIGLGHHRRFGQAHAEVEALASAQRQGHDARGSTAYVTLEPCAGHGRNPPCVDALLRAGVARVVFAQADPSPAKGGGAQRLREAGVACEQSGACAIATALSAPWLHRLRTDLPWVIAKWAQTIDGRLATGAGSSQWITGARARLAVQRLRTSADAVITGFGSVQADDPRMTVREVPVRRAPRRLVLGGDARARCARSWRIDEPAPGHAPGEWVEGRADLRALLVRLRSEGAHTVMVEAGPRLLGAFLRQGLVNEAHVHTGAVLLADARAQSIGAAEEPAIEPLGAGQRWTRLLTRARGDDVLTVYRPA